ncbi:hypothetical protein LCGC14_1136680 [marine sediment metagenome]|uniref:Uncharacterized protein n=1 Tax=marine sediment metagenome TaxID=412755 RepID=A0A0F9Q586_9ZZZZ
MYEITKILGEARTSTIASELKVGELAEIVGISYKGILLRTFEGFVSLTSPGHTWGKDCALEVEKLTPGTIVQLEVK